MKNFPGGTAPGPPSNSFFRHHTNTPTSYATVKLIHFGPSPSLIAKSVTSIAWWKSMKTGEKRSATREGGTQVCGRTPMTSGHFSWTMKGSGPLMLGVPTKPSLTSHYNDYTKVADCWNMDVGACYRDGVQCTQKIMYTSENDTVRFDLDCDRHTLQITNLSTGQTSTFIISLDVKEYFQYACFSLLQAMPAEFTE